MAFYADHPASGIFEPPLQQGDIVFPIPFVAFGIASVARLADQVNDTARLIVTDLTSTDDAPEIGKLVVSYERKPAIVVSQSCEHRARQKSRVSCANSDLSIPFSRNDARFE